MKKGGIYKFSTEKQLVPNSTEGTKPGWKCYFLKILQIKLIHHNVENRQNYPTLVL